MWHISKESPPTLYQLPLALNMFTFPGQHSNRIFTQLHIIPWWRKTFFFFFSLVRIVGNCFHVMSLTRRFGQRGCYSTTFWPLTAPKGASEIFIILEINVHRYSKLSIKTDSMHSQLCLKDLMNEKVFISYSHLFCIFKHFKILISY